MPAENTKRREPAMDARPLTPKELDRQANICVRLSNAALARHDHITAARLAEKAEEYRKRAYEEE